MVEAETLFELLHWEMVSYLHGTRDTAVKAKGRQISVGTSLPLPDPFRRLKTVPHARVRTSGDADTTLDQIGFRVGQSIIERLTKDIPRFRDELELVKYLCKDFWGQLYKKQIDNLRTNRQGVYVLQDNNFRILNRISATEQYKDESRRYLALPSGLLRGALYGLGYNSQVTAEVTGMPACQFKLVLQR